MSDWIIWVHYDCDYGLTADWFVLRRLLDDNDDEDDEKGVL